MSIVFTFINCFIKSDSNLFSHTENKKTSFLLPNLRPNIAKQRLHAQTSFFHLKMHLTCPPFCCKTHSGRRHHSLMRDACETFRHASLHIKTLQQAQKFPAIQADSVLSILFNNLSRLNIFC